MESQAEEIKAQLFRWRKKFIMDRILNLNRRDLTLKLLALSKNILKLPRLRFLYNALFKKLCSSIKLFGVHKMLKKFWMILLIKLLIFLEMIM